MVLGPQRIVAPALGEAGVDALVPPTDAVHDASTGPCVSRACLPAPPAASATSPLTTRPMSRLGGMEGAATTAEEAMPPRDVVPSHAAIGALATRGMAPEVPAPTVLEVPPIAGCPSLRVAAGVMGVQRVVVIIGDATGGEVARAVTPLPTAVVDAQAGEVAPIPPTPSSMRGDAP